MAGVVRNNCKNQADALLKQRILFVFPMASGHVNPSLPLARVLRKQGHDVHYLCFEQMREAIEDTGAIYHSEIDILPEIFNEQRGFDLVKAFTAVVEEYLGDVPLLLGLQELKPVLMELQIPGTMRFMKSLRPSCVVYCPICCPHAANVAKALDIPSVALLTTAGPSSWANVLENFTAQSGLTCAELDSRVRKNKDCQSAAERLRSKFGFAVCEANLGEPLGKLDCLGGSAFTLVTTAECLYDPISPELKAAYEADGATFISVGPLLDEAGAKRAAGFKNDAACDKNAKLASTQLGSGHNLLERACAAKKAGRPVILASLGTVITGDTPEVGWHTHPREDGLPVGITGCQLCRAAWSAVFDVFGVLGEGQEDGPLIIAAMGPQEEPLGEVTLPKNAICAPTIPQVELLAVGVDLFLTHGGQNSFTEGLAHGVPLVVCPGFADQPTNAQKAVDLGVGLKIDRPRTPVSQEMQAAEAYREETAQALKSVWKDKSFKANAKRYSDELQSLGGVAQAVELILQASAAEDSNADPSTAPMSSSVVNLNRWVHRAGA
eukprot:TRINITY_DN7400_c1_g1_i1.p1 TRINITY_DN7400_c1_g1~~TRINITY_DN7400_c1_g1_i1.p1  ORF type:complete len:574 (-),score=104.78 TRINITY_DN7400_c1_g1_i1:518-2170(-)